MPLLNLPLGLLSSARSRPGALGSIDLRDVRDEIRLPMDGLGGAAEVEAAASALDPAGRSLRKEGTLLRRASTLTPVKLPEDRRKGLELMKRGEVGDEGASAASWKAASGGLDGCASCAFELPCAAMML